MQTLFEKMSPENQALVINYENMNLITALNNTQYFHELNIANTVVLATIFKFNDYNISFTEAMMGLMNLFNK